MSEIANREKFMPRNFIREDGFGITEECRRYLSPLIQGEDFPPFHNGLPQVARLKLARVERKLPTPCSSWGTSMRYPQRASSDRGRASIFPPPCPSWHGPRGRLRGSNPTGLSNDA